MALACGAPWSRTLTCQCHCSDTWFTHNHGHREDEISACQDWNVTRFLNVFAVAFCYLLFQEDGV